MRRVVAALFLVVMLGIAMPSLAIGARPVYSIDSVTVTASGGTWPTCSQTVTVDFTAGGRAKWISVYPMPGPAFLGSYAGIPWRHQVVHGESSVTVSVQQDYGVLAEQGYGPVWKWDVSMTPHATRGGYLSSPEYTSTGTFDFAERCPVAGTVLATYP